MIPQKRLVAKNPEEQIREVVGFLSENGLEPESLLYRVFNSDETNLVLSTGTDRNGTPKRKQTDSKYIIRGQSQPERPFYEEMGASSWDEMLGYDKKLHGIGLTRRDGLWCSGLEGLGKNLDSNHDVVVPGKVGIAVYDPSKLVEMGVEFYAFKEPQRKVDALVAVASDKIGVQPFETKHLEYLVGV
ncbi:hypothetical protein HOA91_06405 [Candidatus Woesearchaeota archaeon]|jgi:hypothetical protein|nr:hypothetical protein [Candidatus Woesearchaeota archaeon]